MSADEFAGLLIVLLTVGALVGNIGALAWYAFNEERGERQRSTLTDATRLKIANAQKGTPLHSNFRQPERERRYPRASLEEPENAVHDFLQRCIREFEEELAAIERPKWGVLEWRHQRPNENRTEYLARLEYGPRFDALTAEARADWYGRYRKGV